MPRALELLVGNVTAPGSTFTALTMAAGNSLQVRSAAIDSNVWLVGAWAFNQVAGTIRIRSPRLHDNVQGLRFRIPANIVGPKYPGPIEYATPQRLIPQDTLTVEQTGSGVAGQIEGTALLIAYENLPSISGRFIDQDTLGKNQVNLMTQETSHTAGTAGGFSGQVAINSSFDNLKANVDYALIGYQVDTRGVAVRWQGIDTGNLGVGGIAEPTIPEIQNNWFALLSDAFRMPMIPVFNSQNKSAILIDVASNQAGGTYIVTSILAELKPGTVPGPTTPTAAAR